MTPKKLKITSSLILLIGTVVAVTGQPIGAILMCVGLVGFVAARMWQD